MGARSGNGGTRDRARSSARLGVAIAVLIGVAPVPALARTAASESVSGSMPGAAPVSLPGTLDALSGAMVHDAILDGAADGVADWMAPRVAGAHVQAPVRATWAFPTAGSGHELRAVFGSIDGGTFRRRVVPAVGRASDAPFSLAGIGFPHLEITLTKQRRHRRRFVRLLDWRGERVPHARVRCMNLPSHVVSRRAARYAPTIERLADEHGLAPSLVMAVVARESCFDPKAVSRAGAIGLMQLMPATARELREGDPRQPANNLRAGVRYLARMHELFGSTKLALAAYNAGPGNVRRYGGVPPFAETRTYVDKVLAYQRRYRALELVASL